MTPIPHPLGRSCGSDFDDLLIRRSKCLQTPPQNKPSHPSVNARRHHAGRDLDHPLAHSQGTALGETSQTITHSEIGRKPKAMNLATAVNSPVANTGPRMDASHLRVPHSPPLVGAHRACDRPRMAAFQIIHCCQCCRTSIPSFAG